ncbi:MAG: hypothetical protein AB7I79_04335 [Rhizobiaceae bacterium]
MKATPNAGMLKPSASQREAKSDTTTKVAWQIIDGEAAARSAKTERLRAARLAQESTETPEPPKKKAPKRKR